MNKFKHTIVAIDPGRSGGIATFVNGRAMAVSMPQTVKEIQIYLKYIIETYGNVVVFIEKVQAYSGKNVEELKHQFIEMHETFDDAGLLFDEFEAFRSGGDDAPGKKFGINKMLANYSQLLTVIQLLDLPFCEVYPVSWQSSLGLSFRKQKLSKTERKNRYKQYAANCFPEIQKMTLTIADALCIAQFALFKYGNDQLWIDDHIQNLQKKSLFSN